MFLNNKLNLKILFYVLIIFFSLSKNIFGIENKILFKINNYSYTSIDLDLRKKYLKFIGDERYLDKNEYFNDFISVQIFNEYNKINLNDKQYLDEINIIYKNILKERNNINDINIDDNFKKNILNNLQIDLIRKNILQDIINTKRNEIFTKEEEIDLIYKIDIKYITFKLKDDKTVNEINKTVQNLSDVEKILKNKNIEYFIKNKEIKKINKINEKIRENIISKRKFFYIEQNKRYTYFEVNKKFETFNGLVANIYSIQSKEKIDLLKLKCDLIPNLKNKDYTINNKEYEYDKLNNQIKNKLIDINDIITFNDENKITYIVLCGIKFNKKILEDINLNKKIESIVYEAENNFLNKYSSEYNLILLNE